MSSSVFSSKTSKPMQVNTEHLVELFYSGSPLFDIEGRLFVQQVASKQTPSRQYQECICRLRGNLLWICEVGGTTAPADSSSNNSNKLNNDLSIALVILNKFEIKLCEESKHYEFCLQLNKSANFIEKYNFICSSRSERDKWIESIYLASFEFLKSVHRALSDNFNDRRQIEVNVNSSRFISYCNNSSSTSTTGSVISSEGFFISIRCDNLLHQVTIEPLVSVKVYSRRLYIDCKWQYLACTEEIPSRSPHFARWIHVPLRRRTCVELKFEVYKAVNCLGTAFLVAFAYCPLPRKEHFPNRFHLPLLPIDGNISVGYLSFTVHHRHRSLASNIRKCTSLETLLSFKGTREVTSQFQRGQSSLNLAMETEPLLPTDGKIYRRKFAFPVLSNKPELIIEETLEEVELSFKIPLILMKVYAHDEEKIIRTLELYQKASDGVFFESLINFQKKWLQNLETFLGDMTNFMASHSFRASTFKTDAFLQFVPVNFHKNTCRILVGKEEYSFAVFTHGAYTSHHLGFERGGMKSLVTGSAESDKVLQCWTMLKKLLLVVHCEAYIYQVLDKVDKLEEDQQIKAIYSEVCTLSEPLNGLISVPEVDEVLATLNELTSDNIIDSVFKLEPIELIYVNIQASLLGIRHKISEEKLVKSDLDMLNRKLKAVVESLRKTTFASYLSLFTVLSEKEKESLFRLQYRHFSICTQAITTLVVFIMEQLQQATFLRDAYDTGYILVNHEVLLSCMGPEQGMIEDMNYALEEVTSSLIIVFSAQAAAKIHTPIPEIGYFGDKLRLTFYVDAIPEGVTSSSFQCKVKSLLFNIGVNYPLKELNHYNMAFQQNLNQTSFNKLKAFMRKFHSDNPSVFSLMSELEEELKRPIAKNIRIMQLVEDAVRQMGGIRATCCKSAKDRTGLSVTLQEVRFALAHFDAAFRVKPPASANKNLVQFMLDTLRRDGVRMDCIFKNIGKRKFAFNAKQVHDFPFEYIPPAGYIYSMDEDVTSQT